jgi:hypothetical protein
MPTKSKFILLSELVRAIVKTTSGDYETSTKQIRRKLRTANDPDLIFELYKVWEPAAMRAAIDLALRDLAAMPVKPSVRVPVVEHDRKWPGAGDYDYGTGVGAVPSIACPAGDETIKDDSSLEDYSAGIAAAPLDLGLQEAVPHPLKGDTSIRSAPIIEMKAAAAIVVKAAFDKFLVNGIPLIQCTAGYANLWADHHEAESRFVRRHTYGLQDDHVIGDKVTPAESNRYMREEGLKLGVDDVH